MKKGILLLLLMSSIFVQAQSLKEALYGGKLKNKPGTVIRKGDDLTAQTDTVQKTDSIQITDSAGKVATPDSGKKLVAPADSSVISTMDQKENIPRITDTAAPVGDSNNANEAGNVPKENTPAPKNNNVLWKEYIDTVASTLKTEVLPSKKVKRETYYITVSYTIGTDGQVEISDVAVSPENSFLQQQVKSRLMQDAPRLNPVLTSTGTPRKVNKRHNFTLTKE
jgi:hypothetical protein